MLGSVLAPRWARLKRSSFARGLAILTSASLLQTVIVFGSAPIVARLFTPEQFGIAGLIQAIGVVPILLANGQYYAAIGIARSRSESVNLVFLSFFLALGASLLALLPALYLQVHPEFFPPSLIDVVPYLWTIPAFMVVTNLIFISRQWEIRHAAYGPQVTNRLLESGGTALAQIGLGLIGGGALGLIMGRWLGTAAAGLHGIKLMIERIGQQGLRSISLRRMRVLSRRHWRFPAYQLPASVSTGCRRS
jgi:O-antigen/teichoic acid export membrane protein